MKILIVLFGLGISGTIFYILSPKESYEGTKEVPPPSAVHSSLSLHFFSSPHGVRWSTPKSLLYSMLRNQISKKNRMMGHVAAEIQCIDQGQTKYYELTGMSYHPVSSFQDIVIDQLGFGVIFKTYLGHLESANTLRTEIDDKRQTGRVHTVRYLINYENCMNLKKFLNEYKKFGIDKRYGGLNYEVRSKKRAGCVHFAYALLDIANLENDSFLKNWMQPVLIPYSLIGGSLTNQKVSVLDLFLDSQMDSWAPSNEKHVEINFWDIDRIFQELIETRPTRNAPIIWHNKSKEFIIDRRDINNFETRYWRD